MSRARRAMAACSVATDGDTSSGPLALGYWALTRQPLLEIGLPATVPIVPDSAATGTHSRQRDDLIRADTTVGCLVTPQTGMRRRQ